MHKVGKKLSNNRFETQKFYFICESASVFHINVDLLQPKKVFISAEAAATIQNLVAADKKYV